MAGSRWSFCRWRNGWAIARPDRRLHHPCRLLPHATRMGADFRTSIFYRSFMASGSQLTTWPRSIAEIAQQGSSGGAKTEDRIFDHRLARADRRKEVFEMVVAVAVAPLELETSRRPPAIPFPNAADTCRWYCSRICFLHRVGEGVDGVAGRLFARHAADGHAVAANLHCAFGAGEDETFALLAAIDEVHAQAQVESLAIVEQTEHHVGHIAAVVPEAQAAGRHGARWARASR